MLNNLLSGGVVQVERIHPDLAAAQRAVGAEVTLVALATHGHVLVPQLVNVCIVILSELLDAFANAVSGAGIGVTGARGALASNTIITIIA